MVRVRFARDHIVPQYLDTREPEWLHVAEQLLQVFRAGQGRSRGAIDAEIDELFGDLPQPLIHNGLAKLLEDRCEFEVEAPLPPDEVRDAVFVAAAKKRQATLEEIGQTFSRDDVVKSIAAELKTEVAQVEASLFADLKSEQHLTKFRDTIPERLLERYNVALAQAVLLRSTGVEITLRGETPARYRQLFRQIKFHRLICDVTLVKENTYHLQLDGPLSLFSATQKYGLQLALFLPS
jgi:predicted nuclease of restriction endonuclease-like RecB superfamily